MFYLTGAEAKLKAVKEVKIKDNIGSSEIELALKNGNFLKFDFDDLSLEVLDTNNQEFDVDNVEDFGTLDTVSMEWSGRLGYIESNDFQLYQDAAELYGFNEIDSIESLKEFSYVIDDITYKNGDLLEVTHFSITLEDDKYKRYTLNLV